MAYNINSENDEEYPQLNSFKGKFSNLIELKIKYSNGRGNWFALITDEENFAMWSVVSNEWKLLAIKPTKQQIADILAASEAKTPEDEDYVVLTSGNKTLLSDICLFFKTKYEAIFVQKETGKSLISNEKITLIDTLNINKADKATTYTKTEVNDRVNLISNSFPNRQEPVTNVEDLTTTYPTAASDGTYASMVTSIGLIYCKNANGDWVSTGLTAFPEDVPIKSDLAEYKIDVISEYPSVLGFIRSSDYYISLGDVNHMVTDFIDINDLFVDSIYCNLKGSSAIFNIAFYDNVKTPISGVGTDTYYKNDKLIKPIGTRYVRLCWNINSAVNNYAFFNVVTNKKFNSVSNDINYLKDGNIGVDLCSDVLLDGFIDLDENIMPGENWVHTDYKKISPGTLINCFVETNSAMKGVSFYGENKQPISYFTFTPIDSETTGILNQIITVPPLTTYVRLCFRNPSLTETISKALFSIKIYDAIYDAINPSKESIPHITPYKIFTVCNDADPISKGRNRNYSAALYLDHLFNNFTSEKNIRFNNGFDKFIFSSPMRVMDYDEFNPTVTMNEGVALLEKTVSVGLSGSDIIDSTFTVKHSSTLNSATKNITPRILCIGDSITYAEQANVADDNWSQNWAYHLMCKELFKKDSIDAGGGYDCIFLGMQTKTRVMNYKGVDYTITTHHEGLRGISLTQYLDGSVTQFKSDTTNRFSLASYISKYRTMNDSGVRLTLGDGTGTLINSGNINTIDVCTPTHITIMLGMNGGGTLAQYQEMVNIIKAEFPNMVIGLTLSDAAGTIFPSLHQHCSDKMIIWNDTDANTGGQGGHHGQQYDLVSMLKNYFCTPENEANGIYFIPFYFVQPTAESFCLRKVDLPDAELQLTNDNLFNETYGWGPGTHINGIGHINWAYQLYSWLKYTMVKNV